MSMHDDEPDPTGMRRLLRSLPDPGPMPDHLVARIQASLADLDPLDDSGDTSSGVVPRETHGSSRSSWLARHGGKLAVAAVVVVGGGAVASGQLGLLAGSGMSSESTAGGSSEDQRAAAGDSGEDSGQGAPGAAAVPGAVVVRLSDRDYTSSGLAAELKDRPAEAGKGPVAFPLTAESPGIGPIGTELGVRSCLEALGLPRETAAEVELASVDGTPGAVLLVSADGKRTAYAVRRECTTGNPALLAGPVPVG
ncbi:hypothetical protein ACOCJ4_09865 [Knoellia sp. CPCC 206435]|uniref:hypothetical protein n=1 Tax=Knoellia terrae TaxID=3404797 RepID=UPI003B438238